MLSVASFWLRSYENELDQRAIQKQSRYVCVPFSLILPRRLARQKTHPDMRARRVLVAALALLLSLAEATQYVGAGTSRAHLREGLLQSLN